MATRLHRVSWSDPGITRRRAGRGFVYLDEYGRRVTDPEALQRIRSLVIPPAWRDVWICPDAAGHLQAVGVDDRGRRQYLYHERWRRRRDRAKFQRMTEFARALPELRRVVDELLAAPEEGTGRSVAFRRERVLACAVRLLDLGFFRIGSEAYARENSSFGLATILKRQVRLHEGSRLVFDYPAKSGRRRIQSLVDPEAYAIVSVLKSRRGGGPELLAYRDGRRWVDVRSSDVNEFIRGATGGDSTAKDFRTWSATVLAAVALAVSTEARSATARKRAVVRAVSEVAHYLGNTPAVARRSYIDPRVIDLYHEGSTIDPALGLAQEAPGAEIGLRDTIEAAVLDLLEGHTRAGPAIEARSA
jgi:DNA topoisomerase IB